MTRLIKPLLFCSGEEVDQEAEDVLNELNLLTESEASSGGQGDEYPAGMYCVNALSKGARQMTLRCRTVD